MDGFSGGEMFEAYLRSVANKITNPAQLQVGFIEGATYPDGTSVAMVASIQEFGAPSRGIPPRPFFRNMIKKESPHWGDDVAALLDHTNLDATLALNLLGESMKGELQQSIIETNEPALSPITLMLRKMLGQNPDLHVTGATVGEAARRVKAGEPTDGVSTKPLNFTGHLLNSVDYRVSR